MTTKTTAARKQRKPKAVKKTPRKPAAEKTVSLSQLTADARTAVFAEYVGREQPSECRVLMAALTAPGASLKDAWDWVVGQQISIRRLYPELMAYSDRAPPPRFDVPGVVIQGRPSAVP